MLWKLPWVLEDGPGILGGANHPSRSFQTSQLPGHPLQFSFWIDSVHPFGVCTVLSWRHPHCPHRGSPLWGEGWTLGLSGLRCSRHTGQAAQGSLLAACVHDGELKARGLPLFPAQEKGQRSRLLLGHRLLVLCHQKCPHRPPRDGYNAESYETQDATPREVHLEVLSGGGNPVRSASLVRLGTTERWKRPSSWWVAGVAYRALCVGCWEPWLERTYGECVP